MEHTVLTFTPAQFGLWMFGAMVTPFFISVLLRKYFKIQDADSHVNHALVGAMLIVFFFVALYRSGVGDSVVHSMDGVSLTRAASVEDTVAPSHSYSPADQKRLDTLFH